MNTALVIIGISMLIFVIIFYLKRVNEKRKATKVQEQLKESRHVTEREKIRVYLDKINDETRSKHRT
jgi:archaellum component FlaF (FlaF/FlaG flagellin family)